VQTCIGELLEQLTARRRLRRERERALVGLRCAVEREAALGLVCRPCRVTACVIGGARFEVMVGDRLQAGLVPSGERLGQACV
jgi:hypothetical protein